MLTSDLISSVVHPYAKAEALLADEPEIALIQARKTAEAICRAIYVNTKNKIDFMSLDDLIRSLANMGEVPKKMLVPFRTIQAFGNYAAHCQGDASELTAEYVLPCAEALRNVVFWFFSEFLRMDIPTEIENWFIGTRMIQ